MIDQTAGHVEAEFSIIPCADGRLAIRSIDFTRMEGSLPAMRVEFVERSEVASAIEREAKRIISEAECEL